MMHTVLSKRIGIYLLVGTEVLYSSMLPQSIKGKKKKVQLHAGRDEKNIGLYIVTSGGSTRVV